MGTKETNSPAAKEYSQKDEGEEEEQGKACILSKHLSSTDKGAECQDGGGKVGMIHGYTS
jgi:hypothetical protein